MTALRRSRRGGDPASNKVVVKEEKEEEEEEGKEVEDVHTPPPIEGGLLRGGSAYEAEREERMRRNRERMMQFNLVTLASEVEGASTGGGGEKRKAASRGITSKRVRAKKEVGGPVEIRRSKRVAGQIADLSAGIEKENRDGSIVLKGGLLNVVAAPQEWRREARNTDHVPFRSLNAEEEEDAALASLLLPHDVEEKKRKQNKSTTTITTTTSSSSSSSCFTPAQLCQLRLAEADVAKVVKDGGVHVKFLPRADTLLVGIGDKKGHIGFWSIDGIPPPPLLPPSSSSSSSSLKTSSGGGGSSDGVFLFRPHTQYISGIHWLPASSSSLLSSSYDGTVRKLDLQKQTFLCVYGSEEEDEFSAMCCSSNESTVYLGDTNGNFSILDVRTEKNMSAPLGLHDKKVNTISIDSKHENTIVTSSSDGKVLLWDIRRLKKGAKPVSALPQTRVCQAAYFAPNGSSKVVVTCYDDSIQVWDCTKPASSERVLKIRHDNHTGRWVIPFRADWTPDGLGFHVGAMNRSLEIFNAENGKKNIGYQSEFLTAIPSRNTIHPLLPIIAGVTNSGRVHIWR